MGGTGLYFKALLEGLSPIPETDAAVRIHWRNEALRLGALELHAELKRSDPEMAARLAVTDTQRLTRALEVLHSTGRSLADWQRQPGTPLLTEHETLRLVLRPDRTQLMARCDVRFDHMMAAGALQEVQALGGAGLDLELPAMRALGMPPLADFVRGAIP